MHTTIQTLIDESFSKNIIDGYGNILPEVYNEKYIPFTLRKWQLEVWKHRNEIKLLVNAPTAAGKGVSIRANVLYNMGFGYKCIIIVPQNTIAYQFEQNDEGRKEIIKVGKKEIGIWSPTLTLCGEKQKISTITKWLKAPMMSNNVLVCCYQSFIEAVKKLNDKHLKDIFLVVDEAHHIQADDFNCNRLGQAITKLDNGHNKFMFTSATFFRGDLLQILPDSFKKDLYTYDMTLDKMFSDPEICRYLSNIKIDILIGKQYKKVISECYDINTPTAIWISHHSSGVCKVQQVIDIINSIGKEITDYNELIKLGISEEELQESYNSVCYIKHKSGKLLRIIDLALDDNTCECAEWGWSKREIREQYLLNNPEQIDCIICLNKFKEGVTWKPLQRIFMYDFKSIKDSLQIMGRGMRDYGAVKDTLYVHFVINSPPCEAINGSAEEWFNDYVKAIWASCIINEFIKPLRDRIKKPTSKRDKALSRTMNRLDSMFQGDYASKQEFLYNASGMLDAWAEDVAYSIEEKRVKMHEIVEFLMSESQKEEYNVGEIADATWMRIAYEKKRIDGFDVTQMNYQLIYEDDAVGCHRKFCSKVLNKNNAVAFKRHFESIGFIYTEEEHILRAVELGATCSMHDAWKERGPGYYARPEHGNHFGKNFWKKVRAKLGKHDEKYSEEEHILRAVELGATSSRHDAWKERGPGYYARPEHGNHFGKNFWKKVRAKLKLRHSEEEHILRAVELGATFACCDAWKERGPGYYANPEQHFENFWKQVRAKLKLRHSEEEHILRAVELGATFAKHDAWKERGPGYYARPEIYFGKSFWKKVRAKLDKLN